MSIKAGKLVVANTVITADNAEAIEPNEARNTRFTLLKKEENAREEDDGTVYVVVNGKKIRVGRKSHYLLDMLTLA